MKAYIAISFSKRKALHKELKTIVDTLTMFHIKAFVFADQYYFDKSEEDKMMRQAFSDIEQSDLVIAEGSEKEIGIGIEAGYAKAKGKVLIYLRNEKAEHSTTLAGASDYRIVYTDTDDLKESLSKTLYGITSCNY